MNILQLITPRRFSGAERVCIDLSRELRNRGHRVEVATKSHPQFLAALAEASIPFRVASIANKFNFAVPFTIARIARAVEADIIHTHLSTASMWGNFGGMLARVPVVGQVHALSTAIWFRYATHVIAVSESVRRHVIAQGHPPDRISVVHNAVDVGNPPALDDVAHTREELGVHPELPLVAVVAHLAPKKGHPVLLRALAALRERGVAFQCVCVGEGKAVVRLRELSERLRLGDAVRFLGFRDDARAIMGAADIVALPSTEGEGLPLCLLEAAALGKPVVATRLAGIPEIVVDRETGLLAEPGDAGQLAAHLAELLLAPRRRDEMGRAARGRALARFTVQAQAEAVEGIYRKVLGVDTLPPTKPADRAGVVRTPR